MALLYMYFKYDLHIYHRIGKRYYQLINITFKRIYTNMTYRIVINNSDKLIEYFTRLFNKDYNKYHEYMNNVANRLHYFNGLNNDYLSSAENIFFMIFDTNNEDAGIDRLVACCKLKTKGEPSLLYPEYTNWISYITVDPEYQRRGLAKLLVRLVITWNKMKNTSVLMSGYKVLGFLYLKPYINKIAKQHHVDVGDFATRPKFLNFETCEGYDEEEYNRLVKELL